LAALEGKAAAVSFVAAIFLAAASLSRAAAVPLREPLTVDFALAFAGDFLAGETGFFFFAGMAISGEWTRERKGTDVLRTAFP
jgi:hypothetical protein